MGRQPSPPVTSERLRKAALAYLGRYASSAANLRRVLARRVARSAAEHGTDAEAAREMIETIVADFTRAGLIDDRAFAEAKTETLRRRGLSRQRVMAGLARRGVDRPLAESVLPEASAAAEFAAAVTYARRRRLGPFRTPEERPDRRLRDLAALGRQGFGPAIARRVIDAPDAEALEAELD